MERNVKFNIYQVTINHKETLIESNILMIYIILSMNSYFWYILQCCYIKKH